MRLRHYTVKNSLVRTKKKDSNNMNNYNGTIKDILQAHQDLKNTTDEQVIAELDNYITEQLIDLDIEYKLGKFQPTFEQFKELLPVMNEFLGESVREDKSSQYPDEAAMAVVTKFEDRMIARVEQEGDWLGLSTVLIPGVTSDKDYYETALLSPDLGVIVVQRYNTESEARYGHKVWESNLAKIKTVMDIEGNVVDLKGEN
jgi:hypothetical protein